MLVSHATLIDWLECLCLVTYINTLTRGKKYPYQSKTPKVLYILASVNELRVV